MSPVHAAGRLADDPGQPLAPVQLNRYAPMHGTGRRSRVGIHVSHQRRRKVLYPGPLDIGHAWAYLPDVAETFTRLLDRADALAPFARYHFPGYWLDGRSMVQAIGRAAGRDDIIAAHFPWKQVALAAPFVETLRELRKMRYLWQTPVQLDGQRLQTWPGTVPRTPIEQALRATLQGAGCLPAPEQAR